MRTTSERVYKEHEGHHSTNLSVMCRLLRESTQAARIAICVLVHPEFAVVSLQVCVFFFKMQFLHYVIIFFPSLAIIAN